MEFVMQSVRLFVAPWGALTQRLNASGTWLWPLAIRLILAYEFLESGFEKLHGENWFSDIRGDFPFPFNMIPADFSWTIATWGEILGGFALLFGIATRFFSFNLLVITVVAIAAVHWPMGWMSLQELWQGYAITDQGAGNFKLPLLFIILLLPLIFNGAGKLSIDALISRFSGHDSIATKIDFYAAALAVFVIGGPLLLLVPRWGIFLSAVSLILALAGFIHKRKTAYQ
jgi:putative oxidoreductase